MTNPTHSTAEIQTGAGPASPAVDPHYARRWLILALLGTALLTPRGGRFAHAAAVAFVLGMLLFCGAVYVLGIAGVSLGRVAPAGGSLLMLGWLLLGASALRAR